MPLQWHHTECRVCLVDINFTIIYEFLMLRLKVVNEISLLMFDSEKVDYAIKENPKDVCDENRPYRITQAEMMSKFRKWHLREPKFAKFPGGPCPRTPLEARAFGANNYSLFSITWGWNLCTYCQQSCNLALATKG